MTVEWLCLWAHFVYSGIAIIVFITLSYREVDDVSKRTASVSSKPAVSASKEIDGAKRNLQQIAVCASVCLLLNVIVTILTLNALDGWSHSADLWLQCSLYEKLGTRELAAYEISAGAKVCSQADVTDVNGPLGSCKTDCRYLPNVENDYLVCALEDGVDLEDVVEPQLIGGGRAVQDYTWCDCSCDAYVPGKIPFCSPPWPFLLE